MIPLSSTIKSETGYDVLGTSPQELVEKLKTPAYIMVSEDDTISPPEKLRGMFERYGSFHMKENKILPRDKQVHIEKTFRLFEGEHNSSRPLDVIIEAVR